MFLFITRKTDFDHPLNVLINNIPISLLPHLFRNHLECLIVLELSIKLPLLVCSLKFDFIDPSFKITDQKLQSFIFLPHAQVEKAKDFFSPIFRIYSR